MNKFEEAATEFEAVLEADPENIVAVNNLSVCWLYAGQLKRAITALEDVVRRDPHATSSAAIFNLITLYELAAEDVKSKKQLLSKLVTKYCSDDFNMTVLRLNQA